MAADLITLERTQSAAVKVNDLLNFVRQVSDVLKNGVAMREQMRHAFDDTDPQNIVWTQLETTWGVPMGEGESIWAFVNGTMGAMAGTMTNADAVNMTNRVV